MLANGAHISVEVNPSHLEISFGKVNLIEERMQQIEETIRFVIETRKSKLLFTPQRDATFHSIDSIRKGVSKIQKEDWSLRNRGLFLKAALIVPQDTLNTFNMHERFFTAKDLDIQLFSTRKDALSWLAIQSPLDNVTAFYQPIVELATETVAGFEALARKLEKGKPILPSEWFPALFSEADGSQRLAAHMLEQVLKTIPKIPKNNYVSINFEPADLKLGVFKETFERYSFSEFSNRIVIELAERGDIPLHTIETIQKAKEFNIRVALDDVGAGSARLLSIIDLQPEIIKLDKMITDRIDEKKVQEFILLISDWGQKTSMNIVAEGIEDEKQIALCSKVGIKYGQGFYFGKPAPWDS